MNKIISIIIIGLLIFSCMGVQAVLFNEPKKKSINTGIRDIIFDKKIELFMNFAKIPSISACIIKDDKVTWSKGYGYYDLENNKTAKENTIYNIASITKTITGTALMQLWEQGLFKLDEDVNNYLPFNLRNPHFPDEPITFRMLLSHTSSLNRESGINSIGNYGWLNFSVDPPINGYPYPWLEEHLLPGGKWYYESRWSNIYRPGEQAIYANANFDIISYLIELLSDEIFVDYCKNNIFEPLEMYNTSFNLSELDIGNVAIPYHYHNGEYLQINQLSYLLGEFTPPDKYWRVHMYPVGGLYSTISDFSHFFIAHMNGGVWNEIRILKEDTVNEMHKIQPPGIADQGIQYYGLAWIIFDDPLIFDIYISGHGGDIFGVSTHMMYEPSENIGVIYFSNGDRQYEQNPTIMGYLSMILSLQLLFNKGGFNLFSHIDLRK